MKIILEEHDLRKIVEDWAKRTGYELLESGVVFVKETNTCEVHTKNISPVKKTTPKKQVSVEDEWVQ